MEKKAITIPLSMKTKSSAVNDKFSPNIIAMIKFNPFHQPFTKDHHITLQSIKSEAITMLKVVILAMCFEGDITFVISELKAKASLREFTGF